MSKSLLPLDTSLEAARIQHEIFRRMLPQKRLEMACQMSDAARRFAALGVRSRHPEYDARQVELAVIRLMLGEKLFKQVFPGEDVVP